MAPFPLGRIVATPSALELLVEAEEDLRILLARHRSGDWGEVNAQDRRENERSLKYGWRVLSCYPIRDRCIWIITEADRSVSTILLPEEF